MTRDLMRELGIQRYRLRSSHMINKEVITKPDAELDQPSTNEVVGKSIAEVETIGELNDHLRKQACEVCQRLAEAEVEANGETDPVSWCFVVLSQSSPSSVLSKRQQSLWRSILSALDIDEKRANMVSLFSCGSELEDLARPCSQAALKRLEWSKAERVIVFGEKPAQLLAQSNKALTQLRGRALRTSEAQLLFVATYGLEDMLLNPTCKRQVWQDLQSVESII